MCPFRACGFESHPGHTFGRHSLPFLFFQVSHCIFVTQPATMQSEHSWQEAAKSRFDGIFEDALLDDIDALAFMDLPTRLRRYLSDKVKIQGKMTLQTTHQDIANDLHTSRVVISRLLKSLEREGILSLHRNAVEMHQF